MLSMLLNKHSSKSGFTLIEMLVIAPIVILMIGFFISFLINITGEVLASRSQNVLAYNIQDTLDRIEQDVKSSAAFLATNNIDLVSPQGYNNDTTPFDNADAISGTKLILNSYATTLNPLTLGNNSTIYAANQPNSCGSSNVSQNTLMYTNIIYFVKNGTLWRRTVLPANYATLACQPMWQQPSCAPDTTGSMCVTQDVRLVDNVSTFSVAYYPSVGSTAVDANAANSGLSDSDRAAAMNSDNTVGVTITATQTVAGRTISQSATLRAIGINNDRTATVAVSTPTVVTQPSNVSVSDTATNTTFTAAAAPDGTLAQWQQSTDSGASWTNIGGATSPTLTLPTVSVYMNGYQYRVIFGNNAGSTTSNAATLTVTSASWTPIVYQNNWHDYGLPYTPAGFRKTSAGMIVLEGLSASRGTPGTNEIIGTLPLGYRPSENLIFQNNSNGAGGRIDVWPDGTIRFVVGNAAWFSLDGITFMPSGTTFTAIPLQNSWVFYGAPWATPGYMVDSNGRVHLKGLIGGGTAASGTVLTSVPDDLQPSGFEFLSADNSNAFGVIALEYVNSNIYTRGGSNSYLSLQALWYPSSYTGWTALTPLNGFTYYGSPYSTPRYTKSTDGQVVIKGLLKGGSTTANTIIANLPPAYCPKQQSLQTVVANGTWGRVDITPGTASGCNIIVGQAASISTAYTSLDNVNYYADYTAP